MKHAEIWTAIAIVLPLYACSGGGESGATHAGTPSESEPLPERYWAEDAPEAAVDVLDLRASGEDGAEVVVRGTLQDFGRLATFKLVEDSLPDCSEQPEDTCEEPWDYCCVDTAELQRATVNVEFLDGESPGPWTVRGFHGLDHLSEIVVAGTLRKDASGNMRLEASRVALQ